eukprot:1151454-Pelagomonas_calceolata.AAC.5
MPPHFPPFQAIIFLTFEVPKPQLGLVFFTDIVCGPKLFTTWEVTGPGDHSPKAPFSCSLEIKTCIETACVAEGFLEAVSALSRE